MIKQVFAGVVAIGSVSGVASAQSYISMSPPPAASFLRWSSALTRLRQPQRPHRAAIVISGR